MPSAKLASEEGEMARDDDYDVDGRKIRALRLRKFWRQEDLAREAGLQMGTISRIETGYHRPHLGTVGKVAEALGVDPEDLIVWHIDVV